MNNNPLISIIIPCYNAEQSLGKCLQSVVTQDYNHIEIIIIDDGSSDGSAKIYQEFQQKDNRIIIITQNNSGVSKARNEGIKKANGEYICFVDSDDWVETNYCSTLYGMLHKENADIAIIEAEYQDLQGKIVFQKPISNERIFDGKRALSLLLEDKIIQSHPWGKLYKACYLKNINFPENLKCFEDYSTLFKIFDKAVTVVKSNDKLYHYIQHSESLSHNLSPETAYQFYIAIMEVFKFWQSTTKIKNQKKVTRNIIKKLLMVLKRILRNTTEKDMQDEKEIIRKSFVKFLKYPITTIGPEYYLYIRLYYFYPNLYSKFVAKK